MILRHWLSDLWPQYRFSSLRRNRFVRVRPRIRRNLNRVPVPATPEILEERLMLTVQTHLDPLDDHNPVYGPVTPDWIETDLLPTDESIHTVTLAFSQGGGSPLISMKE